MSKTHSVDPISESLRYSASARKRSRSQPESNIHIQRFPRDSPSPSANQNPGYCSSPKKHCKNQIIKHRFRIKTRLQTRSPTARDDSIQRSLRHFRIPWRIRDHHPRRHPHQTLFINRLAMIRQCGDVLPQDAIACHVHRRHAAGNR